MESTPAQAKQPSASDFLEKRADSAQADLEASEHDSESMPINNEARKTNLYKMSTKDEILPLFRIGERVRLTKAIRNDGTYPHAKNGDVLVEAGAEGYVRKIGDFLQTIRIYEVNFIEEGLIFGCREAELESAIEDDGYDEVAEELKWLKEHRAKRAAEQKAQSQEGEE
ncbi:MAG: nitrogen fixation protein NifZ [Sulfuricurvum sp.]|jgi:nitrogen fixation protein NifZ|uniref:nitrogen fixation protein NifZ n=1 Tax=Sulfuricurvum sp. TaxID=2025608 RepID=UPI00261CB844|nr:nitrogen fixation protein NifZ [Sulfuricurvum sp.]MDD2838083.1 nitrogen fixation protein NifZ [Sulfuricurvum sp.]MDD3596658.1 nitrogen fixation protein NifZ [Sulfuricurvum sp.]MDD4884909.1 nitrogen fixation protein NifZ [Sulfuricurvum sp.]